MPSGGLTPIDDETAKWVYERYTNATKQYGLGVEIFQYFIGGIQAGVEPRDAMDRACIEWDV